MGQNIRWATEDRRKLLLTATPLQNSLIELYGLSTLVDEHMFGDLPSFRSQYTRVGGDMAGLQDRLKTFCFRTLRRQVAQYIQYTERRLITRPFSPTEQEHKLYEAVSAFLQRDQSYALPERQRHLTALIVRKLLASSPQALAGTLDIMRDRLVALREHAQSVASIAERIIEDEEIEDEILDEMLEDEQDETEHQQDELPIEVDQERLNDEIEELEQYSRWARSIGVDTKAKALLTALRVGFKRMAEMGAAQKAVVFTESRRTQQYLKGFLEANGYADQVITFNGTNREPDATAAYERWVATNADTGRVSGSRPVDVRTALIEHFRDHASIMIATEAAAEGVNLQFCSLVINHDLPWNPQRIEQRIGRCHRYGQRFDVVVINFLNKRNAVDRRVYELLGEKFHLFTGLFGASDEVLGSIESGVDFEKRILAIYQECRTSDEIESAFKALQEEMDTIIQSKLDDTRQKLMEHFDEDVHERLKVNLQGTREQLDRVGRMFWSLTRYVLADIAKFSDSDLSFHLTRPSVSGVRPGTYHMVTKGDHNVDGAFLYRLSHPLGEHVLSSGQTVETPAAKITFDVSSHPTRISMVEALAGRSGWLSLQKLTIDSFESEDHLLFSAFDDAGHSIDQEACERLFSCAGRVSELESVPASVATRMEQEAERHAKATVSLSVERNHRFFNEERERLERWADDMVLAAEHELKATKEQIKTLNRQARAAPTLEEQHQAQARIRELEKKKRRQRQQIFDAEDEIMEKRDRLIEALERRMTRKTRVDALFMVRWTVR